MTTPPASVARRIPHEPAEKQNQLAEVIRCTPGSLSPRSKILAKRILVPNLYKYHMPCSHSNKFETFLAGLSDTLNPS